MRIKNSLVIFLILSFTNAFALTEFKKGPQVLQGKVSVEKSDVFFLVNPGTNSQTKFKLSGDTSKLKDQDGSNAELELVVPEDTFSASGEAQLKKLIKFLHPKDDVKTYF
jgi:hypothetical protein